MTDKPVCVLTGSSDSYACSDVLVEQLHVWNFNLSDLSQERMMYEANRLRLGAHRQ